MISEERGDSINDQEIVGGLRTVGAPVLGPEKEVVGALSIPRPINRMRGDRFDAEPPTRLLGA